MSPKDPYARELFVMCQALNKIAVMAHRPVTRRVTVTRDYDGTEEFCRDCDCEVTAGDLYCETCADIRQQTEQILSRGEE